MRRYREMLLVGGITGITLLSYFGYAASIKGSDYEVATIQGENTKELQKMSIEIEKGDIKPTQYNIKLDGTVDNQAQNYLTGLFNSYAADFPADFYRFISNEDVYTSEIGVRTYGIQIEDSKLLYHSYDKSTRKQFEKKFFHNFTVPDRETSDVQVFNQDAMNVYVQRSDHGTKETSSVIKLNLANGEIKTLKSEEIRKNHERHYIAVNEYGLVYREVTYDSEGVEKDSGYYLDSGNKTKRLKALDPYAMEGIFTASYDNRTLVAYGYSSEDSKVIEWKTYDFKTDKVKNHGVEGQFKYQFNGSYTMNVQDKLYHVAKTNDSDFQVTVVDTKNETITYQGIIKDNNAQKNRLIQDVTITE